MRGAHGDHRPLVAVTTTVLPDPEDARKGRIALYANYLVAVERLGITPVLVTPSHGRPSAHRILELCSGLLLTGGYDIDPARYGEAARPDLEMVNPARDEAELALLGAALERELPVLGICRGHQLLNVHFGGTLYQDIGVQLGVRSHDQTTDWGQHHHEVRVLEGTRVHRCLGITRFEVNSFHHQAIKDLGRGLRVTASSDDGIVEAVEAEAHRWVMGVQWHPERGEARSDEVDPNACVFRAFAEAVGRYAAGDGRG